MSSFEKKNMIQDLNNLCKFVSVCIWFCFVHLFCLLCFFFFLGGGSVFVLVLLVCVLILFCFCFFFYFVFFNGGGLLAMYKHYFGLIYWSCVYFIDLKRLDSLELIHVKFWKQEIMSCTKIFCQWHSIQLLKQFWCRGIQCF